MRGSQSESKKIEVTAMALTIFSTYKKYACFSLALEL